MGIKFEQGKTLKFPSGTSLEVDIPIKITTSFDYYGVDADVGETIYNASAYAYPNTSQLTLNNTYYSGVVDTVDIDTYTNSTSGYGGGYEIPLNAYYVLSATVNFFECRFAEHYSAIIRRYTNGGTTIKDYAIGKIVSPITFWADSYGIYNLPISISNTFVDNLSLSNSLLVLVKRDKYFTQKYYDFIGSGSSPNFEYEAGNNTLASFNFSLNISILNPAPL